MVQWRFYRDPVMIKSIIRKGPRGTWVPSRYPVGRRKKNVRFSLDDGTTHTHTSRGMRPLTYQSSDLTTPVRVNFNRQLYYWSLILGYDERETKKMVERRRQNTRRTISDG